MVPSPNAFPFKMGSHRIIESIEKVSNFVQLCRLHNAKRIIKEGPSIGPCDLPGTQLQ
jgi:hypothetical protein